MRARPILMHAWSVQNLLAGRKTQTRRIIMHRDAYFTYNAGPDGGQVHNGPVQIPADQVAPGVAYLVDNCRYGKPGDLMWVREQWQYADWTEDGYPFIGYYADGARILHENYSPEWADRLQDIWAALSIPANYDIDSRAADRRWRPSIHMPRWASRLTLRIVDVRVERLNEISDRDCVAEGVGLGDIRLPNDSVLVAYRRIWEDINGQFSWGDNPWVWALSFDVLRENIDDVLARAKAAA